MFDICRGPGVGLNIHFGLVATPIAPRIRGPEHSERHFSPGYEEVVDAAKRSAGGGARTLEAASDFDRGSLFDSARV